MHVLRISNQYPTELDGNGGQNDRVLDISISKLFDQTGVISMRVSESKVGLSLFDFFNPKSSIELINDNGNNLFLLNKKWTFLGIPIPRVYLLKLSFIKVLDYYINTYGRPDIIHANRILPAGYFAMIAKKKYGIPYVLTERYSAYQSKKMKSKFLKLAQRILDNSDKLIAVSPALIKALISIFPNSKDRWKFIPNVLPPEYLKKENTSIPIRNSNDNTIKLLSIGTLDKNKGQDRLIEAVSMLVKDGLNIQLGIVGEGKLLGDLKIQSKASNLTENISFLGKLSRESVKRLIIESDLVIISSFVETFSIVTIEALSTGTVVLSTPCGGPECILNEENGIIIDGFEPLDIVNGVKSFLANKNNFDLEKIKNKALKNYSPESIGEMHRKIYEEVLVEKGSK